MIEINPNVLYTTEDLAQLLGVEYQGAARLLAAGKVPSRKIGKRRYISGAGLLAFVAQGEGPGPDGRAPGVDPAAYFGGRDASGSE